MRGVVGDGGEGVGAAAVGEGGGGGELGAVVVEADGEEQDGLGLLARLHRRHNNN